MARFTVRVELRDVQGREAYQQLHQAMEALGFSRSIGLSQDKQHQLPIGEYRMVGEHTRSQVRKMAREGAATTGQACSILVTEGPCSWYNLPGREG